MLNKKYRLKDDHDKIYKQGKKNKGYFGMLLSLKNENLANPVFGIVVSKKIAKANKRNKLKRRIRYVIQSLLNEGFFENCKVMFLYIAFKDSDDFENLEKEVRSQFSNMVEYCKK